MDAPELGFDIGAGIHLRRPGKDDAQAIFNVVSRNYDHLRTFMEWAKPDYSVTDARQWLDRDIGDPGAMNFLIWRGNDILGTIGFTYFDHEAKVTEIGYWIDSAQQGKGIVSRACRKLLDHAFAELGMNRVQIRCASANTRSSAIAKKLGFKLEGVQRQHVSRDGKLYDFLIFGLLRDEWKEAAETTNQ